MKRRWRRPTENEAGQLIALAAVIFGGFIYLDQPATAGFPINDGGLFYAMIRAIQQSRFVLPSFVQYNGLNIPFAYPPLGFYVAALLSTLSGLDPLRIVQWLPAVVLIAISIGFYRLALRLLDAPIEAGIATFLYVCTPRSMTWLIMGGGLTRGFGQLFLLLTVQSVYAMYSHRSWKHIVYSAAFAALATLSHPEAALNTLSACFLLWIVKGRNRRATLDSAAVAFGTVALTAIWWLPVLWRHGATPFVSAGQTGLQGAILLIYPLFLSFTGEPMMTVVAVLGLFGLALSLSRKRYFLPAWLFLPFVVDPRGAQTVAVVPICLMAAMALNQVVFPGMARLELANLPRTFESYVLARPVKILAGYLAIFLLVIAFYAGSELAMIHLSVPNRAAFAWVAANTPAESRFLLMTGENELFCDPVQEWFPVLSGRVSETTMQGWEWLSNGSFFSRAASIQEIQGCLQAVSPRACLSGPVDSLRITYNYIYVSRAATTTRFCAPTGNEVRGAALIQELQDAPEFTRVYRSEDVEIFALNR
jgi:hypothetical protein